MNFKKITAAFLAAGLFASSAVTAGSAEWQSPDLGTWNGTMTAEQAAQSASGYFGSAAGGSRSTWESIRIAEQKRRDELKKKELENEKSENPPRAYATEDSGKVTADGFGYEIIDGTASITGYEGSATDIAIPAKVDGYTVTKIGYSAFYDSFIESLTIPEGVTHIDYGAFGSCYELKKVTLPSTLVSLGYGAFTNCESLTSIKIPDSVTEIGGNAFNYCMSLTSVNIPKGVTEIADGVFRGCKSLKSIDLPDTVTSIGEYAFEDSGLTEIVIPKGVTKIESGSFESITSLKKVVIPEGVTEIGGYAFAYGYGIESITLPSTLKVIGSGAFLSSNASNTGAGALSVSPLPEGLETIGDSAFEYCDGLKSIKIPSTVTSIGFCAFMGTGISSITVPAGVKYIGDGAFSGCGSLKAITVESGNDRYKVADGVLYNADMTKLISYPAAKSEAFTVPGSVITIGEYSFKYAQFSSITIPNGVAEIGTEAFGWCYNLKTLSIPASVNYIGYMAFCGCYSLKEINADEANEEFASKDGILYTKDMTTLFACPASRAEGATITVPDSVTTIGSYGFGYCLDLKGVVLPKSLERIENNAFYYCESLASIDIPDSVAYIDWGAFWYCSGLTSVTIPDGVYELGGYSFGYCQNLKSVKLGSGTRNIQYGAFNGCENLSSIDMPERMSYISDQAFFNTGFTSFTLPSGITEITNGTFSDCARLTRVSIPAGATRISGQAFTRCPSLKYVEIPSTVTYIYNWAFRKSPNVTIYGAAGSYAEEFAKKRKIPFVAGEMPEPTGSTVTGNVALKGDAAATGVSIVLKDANGVEQTVSVSGGSFTADELPDGTYTLTATKSKYCPRDYKITVADGQIEAVDVVLQKYGDIDNTGEINISDALQIVNYRNSKTSSFDKMSGDDLDYLVKLADVNGDGTVNINDALQIVNYRNGKKSAFDDIA